MIFISKNIGNIVSQDVATYKRMFDLNGEYHRFFIPDGKSKELYPQPHQQEHLLKKYKRGIKEIENIVKLNKDFSKNIEDLKRKWENKVSIQWDKEKELYKNFTGRELPGNWKTMYRDNITEILLIWKNFFSQMEEKRNSEQKDKNEILPKWFSIIVSSEEFSRLFVSTLGNKKLFSTALANQIGWSKEETREALRVSLVNGGELIIRDENGKEVKRNNFNLREEVGKALYNLCNTLLKDTIDTTNIQGLTRSFGGKQVNKSTTLSYEAAKKDFKKDVKGLTDALSEELKRAGINVQDKTFNISINSDNGSAIFTINGEMQEGILRNERENNKKTGMKLFSFAIKRTLEDLKLRANNNFLTFNLGWGQQEAIKMPVVPSVEIIESYLKKIQFDSKELEKIWEDISKNDFSRLIGTLGELKNSLKNKTTITGFKQDVKKIGSKTISLGESFSDAYMKISDKETNREKIIGFNIKHYVHKFSDKTISIYEKEKGFQLSSDYIYRYFSEDEATLLRFIDYNFNSIKALCGQRPVQQAQLANLYEAMASYNLNNFIRASSAANTNYVNYFFDINNLYIPTSYLYYLILQQINSKDSFFDINTNPSVLDKIPQKVVRENKESWDNMNAFVDARMIQNIGRIRSSRIIFKGLTINLVDKIP